MNPIAIVGRACILPGALSPDALWEAVLAGNDLIRSAPSGRWRVAPEQVLCSAKSAPADRLQPDHWQPDHCWSDRGGYVDGFDALWQPEGFALPASDLSGLDPLVHWSLHCAREALTQAGVQLAAPSPLRIGAILGNLGFPSASMALWLPITQAFKNAML